MKLRKGAWKVIVLVAIMTITLMTVLEVFGTYGYFIIAACGFVSLLWLIAHVDKDYTERYK
jgi:hypothetical protein